MNACMKFACHYHAMHVSEISFIEVTSCFIMSCMLWYHASMFQVMHALMQNPVFAKRFWLADQLRGGAPYVLSPMCFLSLLGTSFTGLFAYTFDSKVLQHGKTKTI